MRDFYDLNEDYYEDKNKSRHNAFKGMAFGIFIITIFVAVGWVVFETLKFLFSN